MGVTLTDVGLALDCEDETTDPRFALYRSRGSPALHVVSSLGAMNATVKAKIKTWVDVTATTSQTSRTAWEDEGGTQFGAAFDDFYGDLTDAEQQKLWRVCNRARLGGLFD